MASEDRKSVFRSMDLHTKTNNTDHHTSEISVDQLIVRRGQSFTMSLKLTQPFNKNLYPLTFTAMTGAEVSEELGTFSCFGIPDNKIQRSSSAKAVWKVMLLNSFPSLQSDLTLNITPPADTPIGEFELMVKYRDEENFVASLVVLFNPWCPDDPVFLSGEEERQEYVMNEEGTIYVGSADYIFTKKWDFGQFEDDMVNISLKILEKSQEHLDYQACQRCNPIYVGRLINFEDDEGVLEGRWGGGYDGGHSPTHWSGSHSILHNWLKNDCSPVKYGQCWVFAGVMCSVMRLLGIPCRVVTNFCSAHDCDANLSIDLYHIDTGVEEDLTEDSVWNFHVWVEAWMKRSDLAGDGKYDGWQVLDPTPQELSGGVYRCGPASVKAILSGETGFNYDVPFVFAEVNADCIDWLIKADGTKVVMSSDTKRVGKKISTKSIGSDERFDITHNYKHKEGTERERAVFKYASSRDNNKDEEMEAGGEEEEEGTGEMDGDEGENELPPLPQLVIKFKEVSKPVNGKDVELKLVLASESYIERPLSISITAHGMRYNGSTVSNILSEVKEETLLPEKELSIPITVPFSAYHKHMMESDNIKVTAIVEDKLRSENTYLAEDDVVLEEPPLTVTVGDEVKLGRLVKIEVSFTNPTQELLTNCTLTLSGSGLIKEDIESSIPDLKENTRVRVQFHVIPYKAGKKTLMANYNCDTFKDIKGSCTFTVEPCSL
ncbi:protein-glutamine gamma-glutamyltransferase E-like isoform 2-T2 [Aulostomus maculatus]